MPVVDLSTSGTERLIRLGQAIKAAGDKNMQRELNKAGRRVASPLKRVARQGALQILPYRGGLAEDVAASRFSTQVRTVGKGVGVRITAVGRYQLSQMDDGFVRHPDWGRWHPGQPAQRITPGWFSKPLTLDSPRQAREFDAAVDRVAADLEAAG
jgi:hypothetical protein